LRGLERGASAARWKLNATSEGGSKDPQLRTERWSARSFSAASNRRPGGTCWGSDATYQGGGSEDPRLRTGPPEGAPTIATRGRRTRGFRCGPSPSRLP
jgi:hypothetical protein